jgi:hypothetical protein
MPWLPRAATANNVNPMLSFPPPPSILPPPPPPPVTALESLNGTKKSIRVHTYLDVVQFSIDDETPPEDRLISFANFNNTLGLLMQHHARPYDLSAHLLFLRFAMSHVWYRQPDLEQFHKIDSKLRSADVESLSLLVAPLMLTTDKCYFKPEKQSIPRLWVPLALSATEIDGNCSELHGDDCCCPRTEENCMAMLKTTSLVYYVVYTTYHTGDSVPRGKRLERLLPIYKVVRYGSSQAALSDIFYSAGVHGLSTAFACVGREEDMSALEKGQHKIERAEYLWELSDAAVAAEDDRKSKVIKMLY